MSLSNNYPNAIPSLVLDFANTKKLDPRVTFTRASTATFYDGKTVAKAEENLVFRSQEFENAYWAKNAVTITANSTAAPDGTTTAETFTASAGTVQPYLQAAGDNVLPANTQATHSFFIKKNTHDFVQLWIPGGGVNSYANFDVNTGVIGNAGSGVTNHVITSVGSGWYRCSMTFTSTAASQGCGVAIVGNTTATRLQSFSAAGTESIYIWGAQTEARGFLTAYTATTTAPITNYIPTLQTAASGVARFEHNPVTGESLGLEIEEQRTNLLQRSDDFANAYWTGTNVTVESNTIVAPDGTLTGDKLVENTTASVSHKLESTAVTVTNATNYTFSIYAKPAGRNWIVIEVQNSLGAGAAWFNLSTGAIGTQVALSGTSTITAVGNGWYRCSITDLSTGTTSSKCSVFTANEDNSVTYTGDGFSGIYIWGAQLEAGSFATSYIKTEGSQVTRSADSASMTGTNFSSWYRADEGSFYAEANSPLTIGTNSRFSISDGTANNRIVSATGSSMLFVAVGGTAQANLSVGVDTANVFSKYAGVYKVNDFALSRNGASATTDTSGTLPVVDRMFIGAGSTGTSAFLNGAIKKLAFYPLRLTNAELQGLTTV